MGCSKEMLGSGIAFALLVAWASHDLWGLPFVPVFAVALLAVAGVGYGAMRLIVKSAGYEQLAETIARVRTETASLGADEAIRLAEAALADPNKFDVVEEPPADAAALDQLPPLLRRLFLRYRQVASLIDGTELDRGAIRPSEVVPGFSAVGSAGEHTELAIKPGSEEISILAADVPEAEAIESRYPSVYHYLAFVDRLDGARDDQPRR